MANWGIQFTDADNEIWNIDHEEYETKEEAIKDGLRMINEGIEEGIEEGIGFIVGRMIPCGMSEIDVDRVIEDAQNRLCDEVGEYGENYLEDATEEQQKELEESLNNVFYEWHKKYRLFPNCYTIEDEEYIEYCPEEREKYNK